MEYSWLDLGGYIGDIAHRLASFKLFIAIGAHAEDSLRGYLVLCEIGNRRRQRFGGKRKNVCEEARNK